MNENSSHGLTRLMVKWEHLSVYTNVYIANMQTFQTTSDSTNHRVDFVNLAKKVYRLIYFIYLFISVYLYIYLNRVE